MKQSIDGGNEMKDNPQPKQARDCSIDVLRGFAILAVILVHFNNGWNAPNALLSKATSIGARCPQLFFIISSYLTWKSLDAHPMGYIPF